jgi:hypothetical protein
MKKKLLTIILLVFSSVIFAQGLFNNGAKIVIGTGVTLYVNGTVGNYRNETNVTNGSMDLSGTLKLGGNLTNNVAANDIFSSFSVSSEVSLIGTAPQTLGGSTTATFNFPNLTVNNSSGIILSKNAIVNGTMTFTAGLFDIGNNNFTFGLLAGVAGTPSAASMIIATGSGQVMKNWSATGNFTFPVGDNNVTAKYSPVSLNFTSGTFAVGAFAGLNLVNAKFNDPAITGSYINRYWNITQTGITGFTCNALFQYVLSDVVGTESNITTLRVLPTPLTPFSPADVVLHQLSASGLTSFGTFTGGPGFKTLNLTLFIEGLYSGGGVMRQAQGNAGNQFPGNTADQISVELHSAVAGQYATIFNTATNINLTTSGLATVNVPATYSGSYYVTIKHRNSIATVSGTPLSFAASTINYNFSTSAAQAFGSNLKNSGGVFVIYGGDIDGDGSVGIADMALVDNASAAFVSGYVVEDADGDGSVGIADMALIDNNSAAFVSSVTP